MSIYRQRDVLGPAALEHHPTVQTQGQGSEYQRCLPFEPPMTDAISALT